MARKQVQVGENGMAVRWQPEGIGLGGLAQALARGMRGLPAEGRQLA